ncbi:HAMP domain-containing histidine kinase [Hujiaoplasma nucleasis]|uniref:histidine kinase n=1 Tax=Hujiaoplasma nucleasis TaxID=2725268 RepID=A0A7L6N0D8_9MOLU|nr:HAMP domain-containing sensor histidine kinase [Hujiaoplasma nucleasis]QLY39716.1 HAMP domain-containing histidine kinase [Hujiaoplasma nucleasis]
MSFKSFFKQKTIRFFIIIFASLLIVSNLVVYGLSRVQYQREHQRQLQGYKDMVSHFLTMEDQAMALTYTTHYYHTQGIRISLYDENQNLLFTTEEAPRTNTLQTITDEDNQVLAYVNYDDDYSLYGQELSIALVIINGFSVIMFFMTIYLLYWYIQKAYKYLENDLNLLGHIDQEFYFSDLEEVSLRIHHLIKSEQEMRLSQKNYVKVLAHDIKTPLTVIKAYIEALQMNKLTLNESILSDIQQEFVQIEKLMPQLITTNPHQLEEDISIQSVIEDIIGRYLEVFQSKNIKIVSQLKNRQIHMERRDAYRLIDNLISNALHYSFENQSIKIILDENFLTIEDKGIGMDEITLKEIEKGPYRSFQAIKHYKQGSGMGMQIIFDIIKKYQFQISISSYINQGTRITIKF